MYRINKSFLVFGAVLLIVSATVGVFMFVQKYPSSIFDGQEKQETFSPEEKRVILENLSAPRSAGELTYEEKRQILENLSAPRSGGELTDEEKKQILENLNAPRK